jgi:hypothetical protein
MSGQHFMVFTIIINSLKVSSSVENIEFSEKKIAICSHQWREMNLPIPIEICAFAMQHFVNL